MGIRPLMACLCLGILFALYATRTLHQCSSANSTAAGRNLLRIATAKSSPPQLYPWPSVEYFINFHSSSNLVNLQNFFSTFLLFWQGINSENPALFTIVVDDDDSEYFYASQTLENLIREKVPGFIDLVKARVARYPSPVCDPTIPRGSRSGSECSITQEMPDKGHDVQQYYQLVADLTAFHGGDGSEFIGFFDADAAIIAPVFPESIFSFNESGFARPHAIGKLGRAPNEFWEAAPKTQSCMLGSSRFNVLRGMAVFPFVVRRRHLAEMRSSLVASSALQYSAPSDTWTSFLLKWTHGEKHSARELDAFAFLFMHCLTASGGHFAQFDLIYSWLWYERRADYEWHLQRLGVGIPLGTAPWSSTSIEGQVPLDELYDNITESESSNIFRPFPRIAAHTSYHFNEDTENRDCGMGPGGSLKGQSVVPDLVRMSLCQTKTLPESDLELICRPIRKNPVVDGFESKFLKDSSLGIWSDPFFFDGPNTPWKVSQSCHQNLAAWESALEGSMARLARSLPEVRKKLETAVGKQLLCLLVGNPLNISTAAFGTCEDGTRK